MKRIARMLAALAAGLVLAACKADVPVPGRNWVEAPGAVVYRLSADGHRLEGLGLRNGITPLGVVRLPGGGGWELGTVEQGRWVWLRREGQTLLVDARRWTVVGMWPPVADGGGDGARIPVL